MRRTGTGRKKSAASRETAPLLPVPAYSADRRALRARTGGRLREMSHGPRKPAGTAADDFFIHAECQPEITGAAEP